MNSTSTSIIQNNNSCTQNESTIRSSASLLSCYLHETLTPTNGDCGPGACIIATRFQYYKNQKCAPARLHTIAFARQVLADYLYQHNPQLLLQNDENGLFTSSTQNSIHIRKQLLQTTTTWLTQETCTILVRILWNDLMENRLNISQYDDQTVPHNITVSDQRIISNTPTTITEEQILILHDNINHYTVWTKEAYPQVLSQELY